MSEPFPSTRSLWGGVTFWMVIAAVFVLLRGVRWDEHYEFAQTLTGMVAYPDAHPYPRALRNALNLQIVSSWLLLDWTGSAAFVCGVRNALYLAATTVPVYVVALSLARQPWVAHAAAALALAGVANTFDSVYPLHAWPLFFSTGHVGRGFALLCVGLLLAGRVRSGALLTGLLPAVHAAHVPLVFGWLALVAVYQVFTRGPRPVLAPALCLGVGLLLNGLFAYAASFFRLPTPEDGPYASDADMWVIWGGFLARDAHRALPGGSVDYVNSFLAVSLALVLAGGLVWHQWRAAKPWQLPAAAWLYAACAVVLVYGLMAVHAMLGDAVPYLFVASMPYRLTNHVAVIWMPLCLACVTRCAPRQAPLLLFAILAAACATLFAVALFDSPLTSRYLADGAAIMFFASGVAFAALSAGLRKAAAFTLPWTMALAGAWLVTALYHQFGFACMAAGAVLAGAIIGLLPRQRYLLSYAMPAAAWAALITLLASAAIATRAHLNRTPDEAALHAWLQEHAEPAAMLVARPDQFSLQAKTAHPFLCDGPLPPWIPYMPTVGGSIQEIVNDWYGWRYDRVAPGTPHWKELWRARSDNAWRALGDKWDVAYVWAPNDVPLKAPAVLETATHTLYALNPVE